MKYKILNTIGEVFTPKAKEILAGLGEVDYMILTQENLGQIVGNYDIFVAGLGLNFTKDILDKAVKLKAIATATTGLDHIDVECAKSKGVEILSLRGENEFLDTITGTAELAFGLLIALARQIPAGFDSVKNYEWDREKFRGHVLYGKTLGVLGLGRLGKWMARYANAFGAKVIFCDPNVAPDAFSGYSLSESRSGGTSRRVEKVTFEELLRQSDIISIHAHLLPETENLFDKAAFEKMKPGAYLINTSRGKIVNEADLLEALKNKKIAGYATDVLADELDFEKSFSAHPLVEYAKTHQNCIIAPHIGGMTCEAREATDIFIAEKLAEFLKNK